jgi:hypothetical protein
MYLQHEAMREPDKEQFLEATMEKEVSAHTEAGTLS